MADQYAPTRRLLPQYGYRIVETGVEVWGHFDDQYNGANSATEQQMRNLAQDAVRAAGRVGVHVTAVVIRRDHLTTVWKRWIPGVTVVGPVGGDRRG